MRALLLYNPNATTTNAAVTDVIANALSAQLKLDVEATKRRDHASYLAAGAAHEGYEVVVALGGDGTVNEVIQGVANTDVKLAIIPGGSTNVWARSLGLPNDAVEATSFVLGKLARCEDRRVNLGAANDRYFCFAAGYGYDADVVQHVERRYRLKRTVRQASFLWAGLVSFMSTYDRRGADIAVSVPGQDTVAGHKAVVCCNSDPYTFLGRWSAQLCPGADLDGALDLVGLRRLGLASLLRVARAAFTGGDVAKLGHVQTWHDEPVVELHSPVPLPLQVDGDYVGETTEVRLRSVPQALTVVA